MTHDSTRGQWFGDLRALDTLERYNHDAWHTHVGALVSAAAALTRDPDELAEVFLPALLQRAERWPDAERTPHTDSPAALGPLYRAYHLNTSDDLDALRAAMRHMTALRHLSMRPQAMSALPLLATLKAPHQLHALEVVIPRPERRITLDLCRDLPPWVRHLLVQNLSQPAPLLDSIPITHLTLSRADLHTSPGRLASTLRALPDLTALTLTACNIHDEDALTLALDGALARLSRLTIEAQGGELRAAGLWALADSGSLDNIEELGLEHLREASEPLASLTAATLPALRRLTLQHSSLSSADARTLAQAAWLPQLERLDLSHNAIGPAGLAALTAALPTSCQLIASGNWGAGALAHEASGGEIGALELRGVTLSPMIMAELIERAADHRIQRLALHHTRLDLPTWRLLCAADLPHLRALHLSNTVLEVPHLDALASAPFTPQLLSLDLSSSSRQDPTARDGLAQRNQEAQAIERILHITHALEHLDLSDLHYIALPALPPTLRTLRLAHTALTDATAHSLAHHLPPHLKTLDVSRNQLAPSALAALRAARPGLTVRADHCWGEEIMRQQHVTLQTLTPSALDELAALATQRPNLRSLTLHNTMGFTPAHLAALRPPNLTTLNLIGCAIQPAHLPHLPPRLTDLTLRRSALGASIALLAQQDLSQLTRLGLADDGLDDDALASLLPALPPLIALDLSHNEALTDASVRALFGWPGFARLTALDLSACHIGPDSAQLLLAALPTARLDRCWGFELLKAMPSGVVDLQYEDLSHDALMQLATWPRLGELTALNLSRSGFTDAHADALLAHGYASPALRLNVSGCPLSADALRHLRLALPLLEHAPAPRWPLA